MGKNRLEAFSDGVIAIILTIMVLELKVPHGADLEAMSDVWPKFASYVVSFVYVGIYWNNHHHLLHTLKKVDGWVMWANMHLLFWLSLIPFATAWVGENPTASFPTAAYGVVLFMAGISWLLLQRAIIHLEGDRSTLQKAIGSDWKGNISGVSYLAAIGLSFVRHEISLAIYVAMAIVWLVPDRRISRALKDHEPG